MAVSVRGRESEHDARRREVIVCDTRRPHYLFRGISIQTGLQARMITRSVPASAGEICSYNYIDHKKAAVETVDVNMT